MSQLRGEAHAIDMRKARAKGAKLLAANDPHPLTDQQRRDAALFAGPAEAFEVFDEQVEAQRLAGDRARNENKAERAADRNFEEAMRLQLRKNGIEDAIGGR